MLYPLNGALPDREGDSLSWSSSKEVTPLSDSCVHSQGEASETRLATRLVHPAAAVCRVSAVWLHVPSPQRIPASVSHPQPSCAYHGCSQKAGMRQPHTVLNCQQQCKVHHMYWQHTLSSTTDANFHPGNHAACRGKVNLLSGFQAAVLLQSSMQQARADCLLHGHLMLVWRKDAPSVARHALSDAKKCLAKAQPELVACHGRQDECGRNCCGQPSYDAAQDKIDNHLHQDQDFMEHICRVFSPFLFVHVGTCMNVCSARMAAMHGEVSHGMSAPALCATGCSTNIDCIFWALTSLHTSRMSGTNCKLMTATPYTSVPTMPAEPGLKRMTPNIHKQERAGSWWHFAGNRSCCRALP